MTRTALHRSRRSFVKMSLLAGSTALLPLRVPAAEGSGALLTKTIPGER